MTIKFCPGCLTYAEITHEILSKDQEEYLLHFSGEEKCSHCDYTVAFSGAADIHEGQPNRNLDDFLMGEEFYPPEKGEFYLPESYLLNGVVTFILFESDEPEVFNLIVNEIVGHEILSSQSSPNALHGIGELVNSNERKYLFNCNVCDHTHVCNLTVNKELGLVLECPKCATKEKINVLRNDDSCRLTISLAEEQYLFKLIGHTDCDGFQDSSSTYGCISCGIDNLQEIHFTKISENDKPKEVWYHQCANCNNGFYNGFG